MATVNKDFKVKAGLIVEGTTAKVNNFDILTKTTADQNYIIGLIGGSATSAATADTVVLRDANGDFAANEITADVVGNVTGNADTSSALATARTISISGDATGSVSFDGSGDAAIAVTLASSFATDTEVGVAADAAEAAANLYTDGEITTLDGLLKTYADTAESDAVTTAAGDATTKANAALTSAQTYADTAEADAITSANGYTDGRETAITTAYQAYADAAESDAVTTANTYTDNSVAALVDGAPELLDTLNELAAALGDNPDVITNLTTSIGEKVAKSGSTMTGQLVLSADPTVALGAAPKQYVDAAETAAAATAAAYTDGRETAITTAYQTYADTAEADAIATASGDATSKANAALASAQTYADTAEADAKTYADGLTSGVNATISALDTDDIAEGATNEYFTDTRAKVSTAALLTGATKTNIVITGDENGLVITAENGVADSSTTDLSEGSNLYFTNARAVTALEAVVPNFTEIDINTVATQVASTLSVATASQAVAYSFAKADYRSAKFLVKVAYGTHTEVSEVLVTLDTSDNIAITEYAIVGTNGSASAISAGINGTNVELLVTTTNNTSTVTVMGTLLA